MLALSGALTDAELADAARVAVWKVERWARRRRMINASLDVEDLCQVARLDVYRRAGRYDRRRGVKASTYLAECAFRQAMTAYKESAWATRYAFSRDPEAALGAEPLRLDWRGWRGLEDGDTLGDRIAAPAEDLLPRVSAGGVWPYVERLHPRLRAAVLGVFRDGRTLGQVAETEGVCKEAIRRRLKAALQELRAMLEAAGWGDE